MIKLRNVSKFYRDNGNNITAGLKRVNLEFRKGEFVVITGESGSGKSTLLNVLSGMDSYEEGEMTFYGYETSYYGKDEWELYRRKYIGFIYQNYNLIDSYTVLQNVECALVMSGISKEEAYEKSVKYLERVGLSEHKGKRASHLSSGQKQRLAIARALAKETEIIVADEPTGNLDAENSEEVIKIFKELSKDHLVIMVTHNYEQVKDYATRKIRLYDAEVAEDMNLNGYVPDANYSDTIDRENELYKDSLLFMTKDERKEYIAKHKNDHKDKEQAKKNRKIVNRFVLINKLAQPKRNLFMTMAYIALCTGIFIFFGSLIANVDDAASKKYSDSAYKNGNMSRVEVKKSDDTAFTEEEINAIKNISNVSEIDKYDTVNDINYYYKLKDDYQLDYHKQNSVYDLPDYVKPKFVKHDNYMRSITCISKDDIVDGRMADGRYEVVVGKDDENLLGKKLEIYLYDRSNEGESYYICKEFDVVGVTDKNDSQFYFSESFCRDLSINYVDTNTKLYSIPHKAGVGPYAISMLDEEERESLKASMSSMVTELCIPDNDNKVTGNISRIYQANFIINEELTGNQIIMADNYFATIYSTAPNMEITQLTVYNEIPMLYDTVTEDSKKGETETVGIVLELVEKTSKSGGQIIEVSEELFNTLYPERKDKQLCVYVEDYAYMDDVLESISKEGFDCISVFRSGAYTYDKEVVMEKLRLIAISIVALIGIYFVGVLMLHMLMKTKRKDFMVYSALGMDNKMRYSIIKVDLIGMALVANTIVCIVMAILSFTENEYVANLMKYYRWYYFVIIYFVAYLMAAFTSRVYNKYLNKIQKAYL